MNFDDRENADRTREGIEVAVQIRDLGDRDDSNCPQYYTHRQYFTEQHLASSSNYDLVESGVEMALHSVVMEWRKNREVDAEDD